ncbi:xanthine dehydrogenase family protein molybdopterin-binding subunit [Roseomonas terrae]|jgi:CO/xanthine dehydrogenase Mo-binding subunit|uniref:Xanthine dehydrogenase family protein molybdopterin-binding subunit n=1 Tax=Neoroseomonas terrae TaxID=424799 RepID=A0ABS5EAX5_9PROT|nr:xanthine dehydrogenase family protein molybdopterin-binding subunit [Neoroseomonas terrae]MBR0648171.1 xanthine dehydrogenase family protein molybdopterin-binding subunit [Neoroseomonas terrae]
MNEMSTKWIGARTIRPDGADKVTGRAQYSADYNMPGMVWGKILRSPHAHAAIRSIDTSKAEALPGVKAVVTAKDMVSFPVDKAVALGIQDMRWMARNMLAHEKALFHGHPIAAVAAINEQVAAEACKLIVVDYEVLPHAIEIEDAIKPDAPILHDFMKHEGKPSNIAGTMVLKAGDIENGFAEADVVVERTFTTRPVHQGYIEPHACTVSYAADGRVTIWSSSQGQFMVRAMTSLLTGIPQSNIRAIPAEIGGGFGAKTIVYLEPVAVLLSKKSGRPVKIVMSRDDVQRATGPAPGSLMTVKIGAKKDGTLVAAKGDFYLQAGCLPGSPLRGPVGCSFAAYAIPNVLSTGYDVVSNRSKVAAYRAPGAPHGAFAAETVLDEIAEKLGLDPLEMRIRNSVKPGDKAIYGAVFGDVTFTETVDAIRKHPHYKAPLDKNPRPGVKRGRGVASGFWYNAGGESSVQVNITEDGNVVVTTGHPDVGGSRASIANVVAELIGIEHGRVNVIIGDTQTIGFSNLTGGSRVTFASAMVATASCEKVIGQLKDRAAKIWKIDADAVKWEDGMALPAGDNAGKFPPLSLKELAAKANEMGGPIGTQVQLNTTGADPGFATHCVDVEVDVDLGIIRVLRYTAAQDVGRALHPSYVEGQIQGGVVQGIGWALSEEYLYDKNGKVDNATFLDYRMPVCSDVPMIEALVIEIPNSKHPQGVRGVGEAPIVPPLAAIANAVYDALGKRFFALPMSPPKVTERLDAAD